MRSSSTVAFASSCRWWVPRMHAHLDVLVRGAATHSPPTGPQPPPPPCRQPSAMELGGWLPRAAPPGHRSSREP